MMQKQTRARRLRFISIVFLTCGLSMGLAGCGRAPSFSILGSFFPAWLVCMVAGVVLAALTSWILTRLKLEHRLAWPALTYPCMAAFFSFTLWLLFFS